MSDRVYIFDTTLRDGEQSPGATMDVAEKLTIARALASLKVDIIEAGFPIASPGDYEAVEKISAEITGPTICALSRANEKDISAAASALQKAKRRRIHTFIATSPVHMEKKLCLAPEEVIALAVKGVKQARNHTDDVEFSAEDAGRTDIIFLAKIFDAVIEAGATTLNIPDTVGYCLPAEFSERLYHLKSAMKHADKAIFSVHCHNDLGLAVANSLAAVQAGARQIECTINGIGERAGNASLEEVVMALKTRRDQFNCHTDIDTKQLVACSQLVSSVTNFPVQPNKAIVGVNAFAHEAGIHQDGVLKSPDTYEIMQATDVGWSGNKLVLGKHSGRHAFCEKMQALTGQTFEDTALKPLFKAFKQLADEKQTIDDSDLLSLLERHAS